MINTKVVNINPVLNLQRNLEMISFVVRATDSNSSESYDLSVMKVGGLPHPQAGTTHIPDPYDPDHHLTIEVSLPYAQAEIDQIIEGIISEQNSIEKAEGFLKMKLVASSPTPITTIPVPKPPSTDAEKKSVWIQQVDNTVAAVFSKWTRFQMEYEQREKAAQEFKDGGYSGTPSVWVTSFADPAGLSNRVATDLILSQAQKLRAAIEQLGIQRMAKYRILSAPTIADAETAFNNIIVAVTQIDVGLSS